MSLHFLCFSLLHCGFPKNEALFLAGLAAAKAGQPPREVLATTLALPVTRLRNGDLGALRWSRLDVLWPRSVTRLTRGATGKIVERAQRAVPVTSAQRCRELHRHLRHSGRWGAAQGAGLSTSGVRSLTVPAGPVQNSYRCAGVRLRCCSARQACTA